MVLRPIFDHPTKLPGLPGIPDNDSAPPLRTDFEPAWTAIERQQTAKASSWWLITQPDHAILSGEIAAHFSRDFFPLVDAQVISAIGMHDAGWNLFEHDLSAVADPPVHPDGRPVAFFEFEPQLFLRAWTASIDRVQEDSAMGAYMVSQHFAWLGTYRLERVSDPPSVREMLSGFLQQEEARRRELLGRNETRAAWDALLPVLQFCDLLSLYLCSGSRQPVEFPHHFAAGRIRAQVEGESCSLKPTPFRSAWTARFPATRYTPNSNRAVSSLSISLK